jgi:threonine dehydrogenase-like Zn-dependent dehydrogenase
VRAITIRRGAVEFRDDSPEPIPARGEVVIDVIQAGICETDLQLARGYMGFSGILGHEFVGVATSGKHAGQRVVGEINCNCRECPRCKVGLGNHCGNRTVIGIDRHDGVFAQHVAIPEQNLHFVPDSVTDDEAVFVEPLAAALQIGEQVELSPSTRTAVLGDGRLGYLSAQAIKLSTNDVTVIGKHSSKLARFEVIGIATSKLDAATRGTSVDLRDSFDVVVDCTGSSDGLPMALNLVRPRGTVVMKTTVAAEHQLSLAPIVIDEITVVGSRCGPFDKAIRALEEKSIDVSKLITHRYPLASVHQAMKAAVSPDALKVVFDIGNGGD